MCSTCMNLEKHYNHRLQSTDGGTTSINENPEVHGIEVGCGRFNWQIEIVCSVTVCTFLGAKIKLCSNPQ